MPLDAGQHALFGHEHVVHLDLPGRGRAQAELALDLGRAQAIRALVEEETADHVILGLGPHQEQIGDRRIGDPGLGAAQAVAACGPARAGGHRAGIGAVVRLGQAEAADHLARGQARQELLALRL
jgi:hypothetical protein